MNISLNSIATGKPFKDSPRRVISRFDSARPSDRKDTDDSSGFAPPSMVPRVKPPQAFLAVQTVRAASVLRAFLAPEPLPPEDIIHEHVGVASNSAGNVYVSSAGFRRLRP